MSDSPDKTSTRPPAGISFKLHSSSSRHQSKPSVDRGSGDASKGSSAHSKITDSEEDRAVDKKDYLLSVEGNQLQSVVPAAAPKEFVIPLIKKNQWRLPVKTDSKLTAGDTTTVNKDDQEAADAIMKDIQSGKFTGTGEGEDSDQNQGPVIPLLMQNKPPVDSKDDDRLTDLSIRPNESTIGDYTEMPIDHFGAAMLKGMGWKPGEAIGLNKKGLLEPIEYIAHPGGLGLGATMRPPPSDDPKNKRKNKIKKPGEVERKKVMPYIDKDGRVKHIKKIGEKIPEHIPEGFYPGNYGRVTAAGPSAGLCGKIVSVENEVVVMRIIINDEDMTFNRNDIKLIPKTQAIATPASTQESSKKEPVQYGLILPGKNNRPDLSPSTSAQDSQNDSPVNSTDKDTKNTDRKSQMKKESPPPKVKDENETRLAERISEANLAEAARRFTDTRSTDERQKAYNKQIVSLQDKYRDKAVDRHGDRSKEVKREEEGIVGVKRSVVDESSSSKKPKLGKDDCWLRAQLRVRIIDQKYKKGRYYNKKAVIVDIIDPTTCICQTDEGKLLEGVRLDMLETMVPKEQDAIVMVLKGETKGQLANLLRRNNSKCIATIQFIQSKDVIEIDYDDICEFVGTSDTYLL